MRTKNKSDSCISFGHVTDLVEQMHTNLEPKIMAEVSELERDVEYARMDLRSTKKDNPGIYDALISLVCEMQRIIPRINSVDNLTFIKGLEMLLGNWPNPCRQINEVRKLVHRTMLLNRMVRVKQGMTQILIGGCELVREETRKFDKKLIMAD